MTIEHDTTVTVNLDPDEAAVVLRALAHEALVQTGRGEDADHYREEARKLAAEVRAQAAMIADVRAENQRLKDAAENQRLKDALNAKRRDADTPTPLDGTHADIAAHLFDRSISDPGGGQ